MNSQLRGGQTLRDFIIDICELTGIPASNINYATTMSDEHLISLATVCFNTVCPGIVPQSTFLTLRDFIIEIIRRTPSQNLPVAYFHIFSEKQLIDYAITYLEERCPRLIPENYRLLMNIGKLVRRMGIEIVRINRLVVDLSGNVLNTGRQGLVLTGNVLNFLFENSPPAERFLYEVPVIIQELVEVTNNLTEQMKHLLGFLPNEDPN
jgi:hypothetical protein